MRSERGAVAVLAAVLALAAGCTAILGGNDYEVVTGSEAGPGREAGADSPSGKKDARGDSSHDARADGTADGNAHDGSGSGSGGSGSGSGSGDSGVDACEPLASLTSKPGFESNVCPGFVCTPGSNAELAGNPHCTGSGAAIECTLPTYMPPTDSGTHDAATSDAAKPDAAAADAGGHDAGSSLPKCSALPPLAGGFTYPATTLYAIGSTAIQPYVAYVAQLLAAGVPSATDGGAPTQVTLIYAAAGSCVGVEAAYAPFGQSPPPISTLAPTATYYDPSLDSNGDPIAYTCELDSTAPADVGISDVFPSSCTGLAFTVPDDPLPPPYYDFSGPVQVMEMMVPVASPATSITYQEAGLVWAYGAAANISPWDNDAFLFRRSPASGTQTMVSLAIGLDPRVWAGVPGASNATVKAALLNIARTGLPDGGSTGNASANQAATMGILSSDVADGLRESVRPLAFQDKGESCAWLPDSSTTTYDKRNVRTGHYPIWGPSHFITTVNSQFIPSPHVAKLIGALSGTDPDFANVIDIIGLYAESHVIPTCAMQVARSSDGASYSYYQPPGNTACDCYYDDQVPDDSTSCKPCMHDSDCVGAPGGATSCNFFGLPPKGYCEPLGPSQ